MGGGIYDGLIGDTEVIHSILDGNTTSNLGPDCYNTLFIDISLVSNNNDCSITGSGNYLNLTALLAPLAYNGGPTRTHAIIHPNSFVLDAYSCSSLADQRTVARPIDGNRDGVAWCDMGAFEASFQYGFLPLIKKPE